MPFSLWKKKTPSQAQPPQVSHFRHFSGSDGETVTYTPLSSRNSSLTIGCSSSSGSDEDKDTHAPHFGTPEWFAFSKICFEAAWTSQPIFRQGSQNDSHNIHLSEFVQIKQIATGCYGPIVLIRQKDTGKYHALKVLQKRLIFQNHQFRKADNEKRILRSVNFPFLLDLKYQGQDSLNLYLYMDYLPGGDLWHLIQRQKMTGTPFPEGHIRFYISQVILALEYLHGVDVIYRDLKPENILVDECGYVKIGDFGYAKRLKKNGRTDTQCGTRDYMPPEIVIGKSYTRSVDYWSLGVLIYEFLTGTTPFASQSKMETYEKIVIGKYGIPKKSVSKEARELVQKLLVVDSSKRIGNWKNGFGDMKLHPWFVRVNFNWEDIYYKRRNPPFVPQLRSGSDTKYFLNPMSPFCDSSNNNNQLFKQQETGSKFVDYFDKYFENF